TGPYRRKKWIFLLSPCAFSQLLDHNPGKLLAQWKQFFDPFLPLLFSFLQRRTFTFWWSKIGSSAFRTNVDYANALTNYYKIAGRNSSPFIVGMIQGRSQQHMMLKARWRQLQVWLRYKSPITTFLLIIARQWFPLLVKGQNIVFVFKAKA